VGVRVEIGHIPLKEEANFQLTVQHVQNMHGMKQKMMALMEYQEKSH